MGQGLAFGFLFAARARIGHIIKQGEGWQWQPVEIDQ